MGTSTPRGVDSFTGIEMAGHDPGVRSTLAPALEPNVVPRAPATAAAPARTWTFDEVYDQHFAFVWRSVRRLGIIESAVDDVVQEVFLVVHRKLGSLAEAGSIRSWLFGIVVRVVKDVRRTLRRKPAQLGGAATAEVDVDAVEGRPSNNPHESLARAEAVKLLHVALDAMPDERKEVFILAELEQMTVPEIADAIGANVNTIYSRLRAARADFERAATRARAADSWRTT
jgi:RNA polymerase sigma-70 factor (ECF subfamily)